MREIRPCLNLLLTATDGEPKNRADISININNETYNLEYIPGNAKGQSAPTVVNEKAVVTEDMMTYKFTESGMFTINGTYAPRGNGNADTTGATIVVTVVPTPQAIETPACMVGKQRTVTIPGLTAGMIVESDETVVVERDEANPEKIYVTANKTNKPHSLVVRGTDNGPVIYSQELAPFWIQAAVDSYFWVVERYDDYEVWENSLVAKNIPANVEIKIAAFISGVTLEDGSLANWITPADLDELGEYTFLLNHPNSLSHSACHTIKAYQVDADGTKRMIGEAYYSGNLVPDDE